MKNQKNTVIFSDFPLAVFYLIILPLGCLAFERGDDNHYGSEGRENHLFNIRNLESVSFSKLPVTNVLSSHNSLHHFLWVFFFLSKQHKAPVEVKDISLSELLPP